MSTTTFATLDGLSEKIATELVFAEAGSDLGLLPVNSLLCEIEQLLTTEALPEPLIVGTQQARRVVDEIFDSTATFTGLSLKRLGQWVMWFQAAVRACEANGTPAPFVVEWVNAPSDDAAAANTTSPAAPCADEPVLTLKLEEDRELLTEFINEAQEHLQNVEQGVLVLEENPSDADTLNSIFRAFHTFKGGSGFLNLTPIETLAHELESLLDLARQHKLAITPPVIDLILEGGDTLKRFVGEIAASSSGRRAAGPIVVPTLRLLANIRAVLAENAGAVMPAAPPAAGEQPASTPAAPTPTERPSESPEAINNPTATTVKVDTLKLDGLVDLVGEMVIAQSLVVQNPALRAVQSEQLTRDMAQLARISKDLQRMAMSLRMVPIRATFQKMQRLVRDVTVKVGKQVELRIEGEDTELDRTIVEQISDPLIHMIRNSIDHGIEKLEVRQQRNKPPHGTVSLRAFHQGGNILIEVADDGGGLDRAKIIAKAIEKGLIKSDAQLPDSEVFNLILSPGFSTADKITDLSGRGVGLDVVKRNIERLRGTIEIQSTPGQGSTFRVFLPLTMAIIDGLIVGIGDHRYIVPTLSVCESFRPTAAMIKKVHGRGEVIEVRGKLRPLLRLYEQMGIQPASTDPTQSIVVVVEAGNSARCILVDQLLGKQEVVIKSLGEIFHTSRYISGGAILGDGRIGLILDPQALVIPDGNLLEDAA